MKNCRPFRLLPIVLALEAVFALSNAHAADFTVAAGVTNAAGQTLPANGVIESGGTLSTTLKVKAVTIGTGASTLTNSGTISQSGTVAAVDASAKGIKPVFTLTNNAGGLITATGTAANSDNVVINLKQADGSYLIDNQGTIAQTGPTVDGMRAIKADADYTTTNNQIINGSDTHTAAVISSTGNDAMRLGSNFTLTNYGSISSTGLVNTSCPNYVANDQAYPSGCDADFSAADGVAIENKRSNVVVLNYGTITGPRHAVDGGDPMAATADSNLIGIDRLTVSSTGPNGVTFDKLVGDVTTTGIKVVDSVVINDLGGTLTGNNGSGVGLDGHGVVMNYGTITGNYAGAGNVYDHEGYGLTTSNGDGDGVDIDGVAYVENWGTIRGNGAGGFDSDGNPNGADGIAAGGGTIVNHAGATIYGQSKGILIDDGANGTTSAVRGTSTAIGTAARIYNEGSITGDKKTAIGLVGDFNDILINYSTGVVTGGADSVLVDALASTTPAAAIQMGAGNDTLTNYGKVEGKNGLAIDMGTGDDALKLFAGGTTGLVIGTLNGGAGSDTLETGGTQNFATGALTGFEHFIVRDGSTTFNYGLGNVTSVQVDTGASLRVNGALSTSGNLTVNGSLKASTDTAMRTITVGGNYVQGAAGVLEVGLGSANQSDKIMVTGSATLSDGATITPVARGYVANGATYTLISTGSSLAATPISAAGGLTATPANLTIASSGLVTYSLSTTATDLVLTAHRASLSGVAPANLGSFGSALESLSQVGDNGTNALFTALQSQTSNVALGQAVQQLSPETNNASQQATQLAAGSLFSAFASRIDAARTGLASGDGSPRRVWVQGLGAWGEQDPRASATGYKVDAAGFASGFEVDRSAREVMGVSVGYTQAKTTGTDAGAGDNVHVDALHVGGYFSQTGPDMTLDAAVALGYNDYRSERSVVFGGFSEQLTGAYTGWQLGGRVEAGFPFAVAPEWSGRWLAGARASHTATNGYTESGNASVAQRINDASANSLQSVLGVELNHELTSQSALQLRARYLHEFAGSPSVSATFVAGGPSFTSTGVEPNRDALQFGIGYRHVAADGVTVMLGYDAEFKEKYLSHQVSARAVWLF